MALLLMTAPVSALRLNNTASTDRGGVWLPGCAAAVTTIAKMAEDASASLIGAVGRALYRQDAANTPAKKPDRL